MHFGIIAAGEGSRLAKEGVERSKPMLLLNGEPMIGRLIRIYLEAGAESINVVVNDFMPDVREYLESLKADFPVPLRIKVKSTPSSMHTFHELSGLFPKDGRFIATTVDTIFHVEDFMRYVRAFESLGAEFDGLMGVTDYIEDEKPLYVEVNPGDDITAFLDRGTDSTRYVSAGVYGLDRRGVEVLDTCMERGVSRMRNFQRALLEEGLRLKAFPMGKVIDVDHASDIERAEEFLRNR